MVPFCQIEGCETNQQIDITSMSKLNYDDHCRSGNQKGRRRMFKHVTGMCPIVSYNQFMRRLSEVSSRVSMPAHLSELRITPNNFNSFRLVFCSNTYVHPLKQTRLLICCCCCCCFCSDFQPLLLFSAPSFLLRSSHVLSFSGVVSTASQLAHLLAAAHVAPHVLGAEIEDRLEACLSVNWSTESR